MLKIHTLYQFGEFALDPVAKVLFRNGDPVQMARRTTETLLVLVENAGQVLTKEEILKAVWTDRVVDEANLPQNIAVIRKTLGVAKGSPGWIETFPGRGYRLEGPVTGPSVATEEAPSPPPAAPTELIPKRKSGRLTQVAAAAILLAGGAGWWWNARSAPAPKESFRVSPATRLPGREYQPALSPDGSALAFLWADERGGAPSVWWIGRGESSPRPVSKTAAHCSSPAWSPDGTNLAYLRIGRTGTAIVVAPRDGGSERIVTTLSPATYGFDYRLLDWSPDGKWLAVSHSQEVGRPPGIWLVSSESGQSRPLTRPGDTAFGDVDPRFSPDGSRITFVRMLHRSQQQIFSVGLDGKEAVSFGDSRYRISSHAWLPDGKTILAATNHSGEFRLWRYPAAGGAAGQAEGIYSEFPVQISTAARSPALAYATLHQDRDIWRLDVRAGAWKRLIATTGQDASPVYAADGKRIAFRSDRSGEEQLWVSAEDGSNPVRITSGAARPSVGRWSPDGRALVFNDPHTAEMLVAVNNGGRWSVEPLGARGVHPVYSADGQWIYAGGSRLIRIAASGGGEQVVAQTRAEALATSADGRYLYFVREPNDSTLWRLNLQTTGEPERVLDRLLQGCTSCWALAGEGVYYLGAMPDALDRQAIFFHSFQPGVKDRVVTEYPEALWPQGSGPFSLSPDGRSLLAVRVAPSTGDAMLVTPFR